MKRAWQSLAVTLLVLHGVWIAPARGYVLTYTVSDNGGCPQPDRFRVAAGIVDRRWSTSANGSIRTTTGAWTAGNSAQLTEIEQSITRSFNAWTGVTGTTLPPILGVLQRTSTQSACNSFDAVNSICFNQSDASFTSGILAFTRVNSALHPGDSVNGQTATFTGEILDADVYFRPLDSNNFTFATPGALTSANFDLESVLTHELGHFFGLGHSSVWRAMMWPFVPPRGRFTGDRPTAQQPDAQLADDDRVGTRILYPDANDTVNVGSIRGRVLPANPIALATLPPPSPGRAVTGYFGAHVVAVDADTGQVVAGTLGGWTCNPADLPTRFDGTYLFERLPVGRNYKLFAEPLDGPTTSGNFQLLDPANQQLCRANTNNACTQPAVNTTFVTRVKP